jgi:formylglycine-generating enzyme required for sulfatase activity
MVASSTQLIQMAQERIDSFDRQYGSVAVDFACHAAFPLSLTTELSYCLREKFFPNADWSIAPQLLLSGLCDRKGHDLYAMDFSVRGALLKRLLENGKFGTGRLDLLADFMAEYILAGIRQNTGDYTHNQIFSERSRTFGYPPAIIKFTALSLLKQDSELTAKIKRELQDLLRETTNLRDRLQLAMFVENQDNLLESMGFTSFSLLDLAQSIADDTSGDEFERILQVMKEYQFPSIQEKSIEYAVVYFTENVLDTIDALNKFPVLQEQAIEYTTIEFVENTVESGDALYPFEFETVQVNVKGKIVHQEQGRAFAFREPLTRDIGLEMVAIPSGKFMMGSPESEYARFDDESPQHQVTVSPFFIGKYPVTQSQWRVIANIPEIERKLNPEPSNFKGNNRPVEEVSWEEAIEFCQRLSRETGRDYRLPTESEWEYACRAGTMTPFYFGKTIKGEFANYVSNKIYLSERMTNVRQATTAVGDFPPNSFGLYDLHGNVREWCLDNWHGNYEGAPMDGSAWLSNDTNRYIVRGGSWENLPRYCRSASRLKHSPNYRNNNIGFRVVCEIPSTLLYQNH